MYKMESRPKGQCLIINNEKFKNLSFRKGSQIDADNLQTVFTALGFVVKIQSNLNQSAMEQELTSFAKQKNHSDMSVVVVLSHGENGTILCEDFFEPSDQRISSSGKVVMYFCKKWQKFHHPSFLD